MSFQVRVAFVGEGGRAEVQVAAEATSESLVSWVSMPVQMAGLLPSPPETAAWRGAFEGFAGRRALYLAPGFGPDDDPGVGVLRELADWRIVSLTVGPESAPAVDGPAVMGPARADWRPAPGMLSVVRGVADEREFRAWQERLGAAYGLDAAIEVKPWSDSRWRANGPASPLIFPLAMRALPTEQSRLRDTNTLRDVVGRLRGPDGCPWDRQQTHRSLRPYLVEEAHEALVAIERDDDAAMVDEFGDVLLNLVLHAEIARQRGGFAWPDVVSAISAKMIRRHPHVFGDEQFETMGDLRNTWAQIKDAEREGDVGGGPLDGLSDSMPSLTFARSAVRALRRAGLPLDESNLERETLTALAAGNDAKSLGDALLWVAARADAADIDLDVALRDANARLRTRLGNADVQV